MRRVWRCGDVTESLELGLYNESVIDDRNERPLTIALSTIVVVWALAFGLESVSAHLGVAPHFMAKSPASIVSTTGK